MRHTYSSLSSVTLTVTKSASILPTESAVTAPSLSCPDDNNTVYTATNGGKFTVLCDENFPNNDLETIYATSTLNECIEHCAYFNRLDPPIPCTGVVLSFLDSYCWIKSVLGPKSTANDSWSAMELK